MAILWTAVFLAALAASNRCALCGAAVREDFEGPEPSWRNAGGNAQHRIDRHVRLSGQAHSGQRCEHIQLTAANGSYAYIAHPMPPAVVIDELRIGVWLRSDRAGMQILARVVFPRSVDPRTGRPTSTLVRGTSYTEVGRWQRLEIVDLPRLVSQRARLLRAETPQPIDTRGALVDEIRLNVYGGPGTTRVWIDDLETVGVVAAADVLPAAHSERYSAGRESTPPRIKLEGSVLMVEGRPFFPRALHYRGEPLEYVKQLGFNTIWLSSPPTEALLSAATQSGLWIICPPPMRGVDETPHGPPPADADIGPMYDCVLTWNLGSGLSAAELAQTKALSARLRRSDRRVGRPTVCQADSDLRAFSRCVDVLLLNRQPLGTSLELPDYSLWLRARPWFARPGTLVWVTIQTEPPAALEQQVQAATGTSEPLAVQNEQLRLLVHAALAAEARGLCFQSRHRLDAPDPVSTRRAKALELINLELDLIEPWASGGSFTDTVVASSADVSGAVLHANHAQLVLPAWSGSGAQIVPGQSAANGISLTVPGVPQSYRAYEVTPSGIHLLRKRRATGGTRVTLDEFGLTSVVLLTQDRLSLEHMKRRLAKIAPRAARLKLELAAEKFAALVELERRLSALAPTPPEASGWIASARSSLGRAEQYRSLGDHAQAHREAGRAMRPMRLLERARFDQAVAPLDAVVTSPFTLNLYTLPLHWTTVARFPSNQVDANLSLAGDFEDLDRMQQSGWRHFTYPQGSLTTDVELSPDLARGGRYALHLRSWPADKDSPPGQVETPPLWVESPSVPIQQGDWVRIQGWVNVPEPIVGSVDGLMIFDSLAGSSLAQRIGRTEGWQQFTLYRLAPQSGEVSVTFALSGIGEAWIDEVTITPLGRRGMPAAEQARIGRRDPLRRLPPVR